MELIAQGESIIRLDTDVSHLEHRGQQLTSRISFLFSLNSFNRIQSILWIVLRSLGADCGDRRCPFPAARPTSPNPSCVCFSFKSLTRSLWGMPLKCQCELLFSILWMLFFDHGYAYIRTAGIPVMPQSSSKHQLSIKIKCTTD